MHFPAVLWVAGLGLEKSAATAAIVATVAIATLALTLPVERPLRRLRAAPKPAPARVLVAA